jgi:hypothetical protein
MYAWYLTACFNGLKSFFMVRFPRYVFVLRVNDSLLPFKILPLYFRLIQTENQSYTLYYKNTIPKVKLNNIFLYLKTYESVGSY